MLISKLVSAIYGCAMEYEISSNGFHYFSQYLSSIKWNFSFFSRRFIKTREICSWRIRRQRELEISHDLPTTARLEGDDVILLEVR